MVLRAVGPGERQRSLLDHFARQLEPVVVGWDVRRGIRPQGERKGRGVGSQECSIICGKELKSLGRLLRVLPRSQLS